MFPPNHAHTEDYLDEQLPELLDDVLNGIEHPLWLLSLEGEIRAANLAALELLDYSPGQMRGLSLEALLADKALALLISQGLLRDGALVNFHLPLRTREGEEVPVSLDSRVLFGRHDQAMGILLVAKDLRKGDQLHNKLVQSAKMAVMGQMAAGIAHEINNPLTGVLGLAELLLEDTELKPEAREDLELLQSHARRCKIVVERLLSLARAQEDLRWEAADVNGVVEEAMRLAGNELKLNRVTVVRRLDPDLQECWTDPDHLLQVFLNLIINAARAMPSGGELTVRSTVDGDRVKIEFQDTGVGIAQPDLEKIFEPFYTTSSGLGLGLSLSQTIVRALGGDVRASSHPGEGSSFIVELQRLVPELEGVAWQCLKSLRDRRRAPRLQEKWPVNIEAPLIEGSLFTSDIGAGGIRVELPQPLPLHGEQRLVLNLQGTDLQLKARVMWQEHQPETDRYEAGLMFTELSHQAAVAIRSFLDYRLAQPGQEEGRRNRLRLPRLRYVRFQQPDRDTASIGSGILLDLTPRGAKMLSGIRLETDARVSIRLDFDRDDHSITVPATVRWNRSLERLPGEVRERYLHGLEFSEESPELEAHCSEFHSRRAKVRLTDISGGLKTLLNQEGPA